MPKFAVITGASSGIGAEFARQLSARGYNLLLVARRSDRLEKLSDQLTTVCEIMTADLSKKSECLRLVKALDDRRVDLFINNAGFGDCGPVFADRFRQRPGYAGGQHPRGTHPDEKNRPEALQAGLWCSC